MSPKQLIKRLSVSEAAKPNHLLIEFTFGDRAPSQLLNETKPLSGDKVGTGLLQSLWMHRLPESTQDVLACAESWSSKKLVATAYKIH